MLFFFFSSRRRHTRSLRDWSSDVCSSDLRQISTIYTQSNQYRVILEAQPRYQRDPAALSKIYVTGSSTSTGTVATVGNTVAGSTNTNTSATPNAVTGSNQIPLSTFARFEHTSAPLS